MNIKKVLALFAIALASAFSAHAAEKLYWTGNAGDFKWSSADNWALGSASGDAPQSLEPATAYRYLFSGLESDIVVIQDIDVIAGDMSVDSDHSVEIAGSGSVKPMPLTVASMKTEGGAPHGFVTTGRVTSDKIEKAFFGTGFVFRPESGDANAMLNYMARNGYRHHVAFVEGDWSSAVEESLVNYLGYDMEQMHCMPVGEKQSKRKRSF